MLYKLNSLQYSNLIDHANAHDCGSVYPLSVVEGIQEGDIYADSIKDCGKVLYSDFVSIPISISFVLTAAENAHDAIS